MSEGPTYVYSANSQFQEPIFVVYQRAHVRTIALALGLNVEDLYVTKDKLHPYDGNRYRGTHKSGSVQHPRVTSTS